MVRPLVGVISVIYPCVCVCFLKRDISCAKKNIAKYKYYERIPTSIVL